MTEGIPVVRMYTDSSGHTRFAKMQIPVEVKTLMTIMRCENSIRSNSSS